LPADVIEKNQAVATEVFASLVPAAFRPDGAPVREEVALIGYDDPLIGTPSILDAGNAVLQHTGAWRVDRPVIDRDLCTRCGLCIVRCPDGAIALDEHGYPVIDYDHCKGCMICRHECPVLAIVDEKETRAW
jgi:2-oxoacid:acceptor oxidoreductase delta subunit (pyruvate/2-ketoisovalerate family)